MLPNRIERLLVRVALAVALAGGWLAASAVQKSSPGNPSADPLATARTQLEWQELDSAEKTLWGILSTDPNNQDALTLFGVVRAKQHRYPEAEALFRRVLQLNPKSVIAARNLAGALLADDKPEEALAEYKRAIELSPEESGLRIDAAQIELGRSNFAEALSFLNGIKPEQFQVTDVPLKAAAFMGLGRKADAEALIPAVRTSTEASLNMAQIFLDGNDPDAALKCLIARPGAKPSARGSYLKGRAQLQKGNQSLALASFRQALTEDPKSIPSFLAIAEILALENKHAESLRILEQARAVNPESAEVLRHIIVEAMMSGQNDRALQVATDLQRVSSSLDDRYLVSSVMIQQKQFVPASHILEDYVARRPDDAKAYLGLGMTYLALLRYPEARQALDRSLQLNPKLAETEYQLGLLESQQGNREESVQHWKRAVELQPSHAKALFSLGTVSLEAGELPDALNYFQRSLSVDPANMKTEYNIALVLGKLGRSDEAKKHLDRYREMQEAEHASSGSSVRDNAIN
jgi:superkiller protein 3